MRENSIKMRNDNEKYSSFFSVSFSFEMCAHTHIIVCRHSGLDGLCTTITDTSEKREYLQCLHEMGNGDGMKTKTHTHKKCGDKAKILKSGY